jgi:SAM-dependent methyltransferase
MNRNAFCHILEHPWIYRFSQLLLSFGGDKVTPKIQQLIEQLPPAHRILDIGCGPSSLLWQTGLHPIGLDLSHAYALAFRSHGDSVITGSAVTLPFLERSFDGVWSIGLLHHLRDDEARRALGEMIRICRPGGYIVVFDAVLPNPGWRHPVAYLIRRTDRGRYVRREEDFKALLPFGKDFIVERITYSLYKLEGMLVYGVCP